MLWSRGLSGVQIWLSKPFYHFREARPEDTPFIFTEDHGIVDVGWRLCSGPMQHPIVFSELIGYSDGEDAERASIAEYVWDCIRIHFKNAPFGSTWAYMEENKEVLSKDFLLKLDINISLKK